MDEEFAKLIQALVLSHTSKGAIIGTAVEVGDDKCDVKIEGEAGLFDVQFHAIEDTLNSKIVIKPKEGSKVIVAFLNNSKTDAYIAQCSEIEEVLIKMETMSFSIKKEGLEIKKGTDSLKDALKLMIESEQQVVVLYGNNPNYTKLAQALAKINSIFR